MGNLLVRPALELAELICSGRVHALERRLDEFVQDDKGQGRPLVYTCAAGTAYLW